MRLIEADDLDFSHCDSEFDCIWIVENAPTIDAVTVVRCVECKSHGMLKGGELFCGRIHTGIYGQYHTVKSDDFCSYGERRNNG